MEVLDDITMTFEMIDRQKKRGDDRYYDFKRESFSKMSPCYLFSNENLREYYPHFQLKNSNVLTVCGSGDQVMSSILYGAKNIDTFDSNKLAYYNLMLKIAALKTLSYENFLSFYSINDLTVDRLKFYDKVSNNISNRDVKLFWDTIFEDCFVNFSWMFLGGADYNELVSKRIPYMDKQNFNILKDKIDDSNINFKNIDIFQIFDEFNKKYSFINLSNIYCYIKDKNKFIELNNKLKKYRLSNNGTILLNYNWSIDIWRLDCDNEVFKKLKAKFILINDLACNNYDDKGYIAVLKKSL